MDFFFRGSDPPLWAPRALWAVVLKAYSVAQLKKKKCLPDIDFLGNQTGGEKEHSRKPIIFSATNRSEQSETNKTHYFLSNQEIGNFFFSLQYFLTSKVKTRINIQTLGLNNKTLQN